MQQIVIPHAVFEISIFASTDSIRENLPYIRISMHGDYATAQATDGHRAIDLRFDGIFPHEKEVLFSRDDAQKLCKAARTKKARLGSWTVDISEEDIASCNHVELGITIAIPVMHNPDTPL